MRRMCIAMLLASLLPAAAQDATQGSQEKVSFEKVAFPFEGEVSADRLNVRMLPDTTSNSIIATILSAGEKVTVVGEKNGFYQILPPKGCSVWVYGKNLKVKGQTGTSLGDSVPVRIDSRINATPVGTLKTGDTVRILKDHMGWYRIEAPASVPYFVGSKHVRMTRALDLEAAGIAMPAGSAPAVTVADGDAEARAKIREAEEIVAVQGALLREKKIRELDYAAAVAAYEGAVGLAKTDSVRKQAEDAVKMYKELQQKLDWMKAQIGTMDEVLAAERKTNEAVAAQKSFALTGYLDTVGLLWNRPGPFKLVMGGKTLCFLKPLDGDEKMIETLKWNYKNYVGVNGTLIKNPEGWEGYSLIVVTEIVPLIAPK